MEKSINSTFLKFFSNALSSNYLHTSWDVHILKMQMFYPTAMIKYQAHLFNHCSTIFKYFYLSISILGYFIYIPLHLSNGYRHYVAQRYIKQSALTPPGSTATFKLCLHVKISNIHISNINVFTCNSTQQVLLFLIFLLTANYILNADPNIAFLIKLI